MPGTNDKRRGCPSKAILFEDLLPRTEVKGGSGKLLFGTLEPRREKRQPTTSPTTKP